MSDPYGIPDNMFGQVPEEFYGLVGRIALVATLLEDRVLSLLWQMDEGVPQSTHAGKPTAEIFKLCRQRLTRLGAPFRDEVSALLDDAQACLRPSAPSPGRPSTPPQRGGVLAISGGRPGHLVQGDHVGRGSGVGGLGVT